MTTMIHGVECEAVPVPTNAAPVRELMEELGYNYTICGVCPNRMSAGRQEKSICDTCITDHPDHVYVPATLAPIFKLRIEP